MQIQAGGMQSPCLSTQPTTNTDRHITHTRRPHHLSYVTETPRISAFASTIRELTNTNNRDGRTRITLLLLASAPKMMDEPKCSGQHHASCEFHPLIILLYTYRSDVSIPFRFQYRSAEHIPLRPRSHKRSNGFYAMVFHTQITVLATTR